jgi:hypothetical protein
MSLGMMRDIGAWITGYLCRIPETITAGAGNDGSEVDGPWINVKGTDGEGIEAHGAAVLLCWSATLADTETLTVGPMNLQDATDISGTGAADFGPTTAAAVVATASGAQTLNGVTMHKVKEFNGNRGYVRLQSTVDLSATGTDTVDVAAILVLGGSAELPKSPGVHSLT